MTALIFNVQPEQVIVVMDTLSTDLQGTPNGYTSKAFPIPHLGGLMCVTGLSNFASDWLVKLLRFVAKDMAHLDEFVEPVLRQLWGAYADAEGITSTVYHFGYSLEEKRYVAFAYRSENDFVSERLGDGLRTKPGCEFMIESLQDFARAVRRQRQEQEGFPLEKRVFIGGEIQMTILENRQVTIATVDRFEDYDEMYETICEQFPLN
ncbi:hypothetical protein [Duganella sp. LjRoot269]|uniref:hypothetical protein n=1 Tax=Duganella sp. LjRoot269 TaxID=3342305 RepID=UPI003ECF2BE0